MRALDTAVSYVVVNFRGASLEYVAESSKAMGDSPDWTPFVQDAAFFASEVFANGLAEKLRDGGLRNVKAKRATITVED